jgi:hypothetical protein
VDEGMNRLHMEERIQEIQIKNNNIMDGQDWGQRMYSKTIDFTIRNAQLNLPSIIFVQILDVNILIP